jgi:hypothetical protein
MKKFLLSLATIFALCTPVVAQVQQNGNVFSAPTTEQRDKARADSIGAYWEDSEGQYPIYMGSRGGLFYFKVATSGKHAGEAVKHYIPRAQAAEIKQAMGIKEDQQQNINF